MTTETISFARGAPSADILPAEAVRRAAASALQSDWQRALSYGTGVGHPGLREWIAEELHRVPPEQVMVTNGSLEAGAMLFQELLEPGARVAVEQPSYDRTLLLLRHLGVELVPIPMEADGLDVGALEGALEQGPLTLLHVIPNFHNPAGSTLSIDKRERIVELAAEHGFTVFEDDPYRLVCFEQECGASMLEMDEADRVVHASSFSKTVSPGVRVGYLAGPTERIAALARRANETYISPNMLAESIVWELCRSGGLTENIELVNARLAERRDALVEALEAHVPTADFVAPGGGYFLWMTVPEADTPAAQRRGAELGVSFVAGPDFLIEGGEESLRLSFASVPAEQMDEGARRLAQALQV